MSKIVKKLKKKSVNQQDCFFFFNLKFIYGITESRINFGETCWSFLFCVWLFQLYKIIKSTANAFARMIYRLIFAKMKEFREIPCFIGFGWGFVVPFREIHLISSKNPNELFFRVFQNKAQSRFEISKFFNAEIQR